MKKTVLTIAVVIFAMGANVLAKESNKSTTTKITHFTTTVEVSTFCKAIIKGDIAMIKKMIAMGEDVNQKSLGMTPLMFAARYNKVEVVSLLIEHGADVKAVSNQGFTAKKYAELSNANEALQLIEVALGN
ncbi:ankyrin repeat domain-containing protein [Maribacter sp. LLG6340-A2]|uniref:ankyrin repeat domain-containing protein n=1 Tax=Maribacter sp. LLG6340-A2 TaxID=3160834 RepID=UPI00386690D8